MNTFQGVQELHEHGVVVAGASPEAPGTLPDHPEAQQEVSNGVREHGVPKSVLSDDQELVEESTEDASEPLKVFQTE